MEISEIRTFAIPPHLGDPDPCDCGIEVKGRWTREQLLETLALEALIFERFILGCKVAPSRYISYDDLLAYLGDDRGITVMKGERWATIVTAAELESVLGIDGVTGDRWLRVRRGCYSLTGTCIGLSRLIISHLQTLKRTL